MGVITLFGAKGSPGVTTTALLAAALWPRPAVLVDADSEGGDVALRLRRADGAPIDRSLGLLTLLPLARRELAGDVVPEHAQTVLGGVEVVAGLAGPEQVNAVGPLWGSLAAAFRSMPRRRRDHRRRTAALAVGAPAPGSGVRPRAVRAAPERHRRGPHPRAAACPGAAPALHRRTQAPRRRRRRSRRPNADRDVQSVASSITGAVPGVEMLGHRSRDRGGCAPLPGRTGQPAGADPARALGPQGRRHVAGSVPRRPSLRHRCHRPLPPGSNGQAPDDPHDADGVRPAARCASASHAAEGVDG